jgi:hypothetical protein
VLNLMERQPIDRDFCQIRAVMPGRLKMGSAGQQGGESSRWDLLDQKSQEFSGGWICPVEILKNKQDRLLLRKFQ